jgi:hypothetical protein
LLTTSARETLHATHTLGQSVVPVGEPLGTLEQKLPGQLTLRALTVSRATGMPVASFTAAGLHGSLEAAPLFDVVKMAERSLTPGPLSNEEGLALSGERQELYRFGASSGSAWTYHLPSRSWSKTALAAGRRPGRVLSATYRHQDQAVYEVDRGALLLTRLRRWIPGSGQFQTIAMWPTPWRSFSRYWLVNGHGGELFLVGSRSGLSAIAKFSPDASGTLRFGGVLVLQETIGAMPVASRNTIGYVVRAPGDTITGGGAKQKHVPIASIGRWLAGWCPQQGVE